MISNLAGNQITNFLKQYSEYGLPFSVVGFAFDTAVAWGLGKGNFSGVWPLVSTAAGAVAIAQEEKEVELTTPQP